MILLFKTDMNLAAAVTAVAVVIGLTVRVLLIVQSGKKTPLWRQLFFRTSRHPQ